MAIELGATQITTEAKNFPMYNGWKHLYDTLLNGNDSVLRGTINGVRVSVSPMGATFYHEEGNYHVPTAGAFRNPSGYLREISSILNEHSLTRELPEVLLLPIMEHQAYFEGLVSGNVQD